MILGMPFFRDVQPEVNWKQRIVKVHCHGRAITLPVVNFANESVQVVMKSWPGAICDQNTFRDLPIECDDVANNSTNNEVVARAPDTVNDNIEVIEYPKPPRDCKTCGSYLWKIGTSQCNKCAKRDF